MKTNLPARRDDRIIQGAMTMTALMPMMIAVYGTIMYGAGARF